MISFNCVIATSGRKTLKRAVRSIYKQLNRNDYLTIIFDGCDVDHSVYAGARCNVVIYHEPVALGFWGHAARNKYQSELKGDYIMNADDDDVYVVSAMKKIRDNVKGHQLFIFKLYYNEHVIPIKPGEVRVGNIGTPCGVYPNIKTFPEWVLKYGGDGLFYVELSKLVSPVWIDEIIYVVDPKPNSEMVTEVVRACEKCASASLIKEERIRSLVWICRRCNHEHRINRKYDYPLL